MLWDRLGGHLGTWATQRQRHARQLGTSWDTSRARVNQHPQSWHLHLLEWSLLVAILAPKNVRNWPLWVPIEPFHWLHENSVHKTAFLLYAILLRGWVPMSQSNNLLCQTRDKVLGEFFHFQTAWIFTICQIYIFSRKIIFPNIPFCKSPKFEKKSSKSPCFYTLLKQIARI
jgi:hypothetical protein